MIVSEVTCRNWNSNRKHVCDGAAGETRNRGHSPLGVLGPASERAGESESDVWRKLSLRFSPQWNIQVLDDQLVLLCSFDRQANLFISSYAITPSFSSQTSKEGKIVISYIVPFDLRRKILLVTCRFIRNRDNSHKLYSEVLRTNKID